MARLILVVLRPRVEDVVHLGEGEHIVVTPLRLLEGDRCDPQLSKLPHPRLPRRPGGPIAEAEPARDQLQARVQHPHPEPALEALVAVPNAPKLLMDP